MKKLLFLLVIGLLASVQLANADENKLATYEVYYNGQTATVYDAELKIGEPATVKVEILLKKNVNISTGLTATGFSDKDPNQPFEVIEGPSQFTKTAREWGHKSGDTITFEWVIKPTAVGAGWTIPLNIDFNFFDRDTYKNNPVYFTVANIRILNEKFTGANPTPKSNPQTTVTTSVASGTPSKSTPFISMLLMLGGLLAAWRWKRG